VQSVLGMAVVLVGVSLTRRRGARAVEQGRVTAGAIRGSDRPRGMPR
jgi:hypothetical protein